MARYRRDLDHYALVEFGCAAAIEKKLNATAGISSATVDFDSKTALVHFDQKRISGIQIQEVVTQVGKQYKVKEYTEQ